MIILSELIISPKIIFPIAGVTYFWVIQGIKVKSTHFMLQKWVFFAFTPCTLNNFSGLYGLAFGNFLDWTAKPFIRVSQCVKSLKVYVFPPKSHYLGQACLKSAKILKINLNLEVPKVIQSYSTAVCSENSSQNSFWQKIIIPKLQITRTFNIFHYQGPNFEI